MRGTAAGERIVSQAQNKAFDEGHERIFGANRKPQRGRWVWDAQAGKLVDAANYVPAEHARNAPIMVDRFYEGARMLDGADVGSRKKHRRYLKDRGVTTADDYAGKGGEWERAAERRKRFGRLPEDSAHRKEIMGRELYRIEKLSQSAYDREVAQRERQVRERGPMDPMK